MSTSFCPPFALYVNIVLSRRHIDLFKGTEAEAAQTVRNLDGKWEYWSNTEPRKNKSYWICQCQAVAAVCKVCGVK